MTLNDAQQQRVKSWIAEGVQPGEIQKRLVSEFDLRLTYMEVKLLLAELDLKPKDKDVPAPPTVPATAPTAPRPANPLPGGGTPAPDDSPSAARVSVSVDELTRAGAAVSGKVTFSDGQTGEWFIDATGRLGFAPKTKGYRPSAADLASFQDELQITLARYGF
jgi:hypothetical protein